MSSKKTLQGVLWGLTFATLYSIYVVVLFVLEGQAPFARHNTSLIQLVAIYYTGGVLAGAFVGTFLPRIRNTSGAALVGAFAGILVVFPFEYARNGFVIDWPVLLTTAFILGAPAGAILWKTTVTKGS